MESFKDIYNIITHPLESLRCTFLNAVSYSKYVFIIICMVGFIMYCAKIKKGRDISIGSIIIYATLKIIASCL